MRIPVAVKVADAAPAVSATTCNLSVAGAHVSRRGPVLLLSRCRLILKLPASPKGVSDHPCSIEAYGTVVRPEEQMDVSEGYCVATYFDMLHAPTVSDWRSS